MMACEQAVECVVPDEIVRRAVASFEDLAATVRFSAEAAAKDHLNLPKSLDRAKRLELFTPLKGSKVLEVGCGFGTNLIVWTRHFDIDGYGVEPGGTGFEASFSICRDLLAANGLDTARVTSGVGEDLPFDNDSFDIVFSSNVLEHTQDPAKVLEESIRVLRPGGTLHFEMPNFLTPFEGHYMMPQPPLLARWMLPAWLKLFGRDPEFARTLQTQINPPWLRRTVRALSRRQPVIIQSLGEEIFCRRLAAPFNFESRRVRSSLGKTIRLCQAINLGNWLSKVLVLSQTYYPIYLTLSKLPV